MITSRIAEKHREHADREGAAIPQGIEQAGSPAEFTNAFGTPHEVIAFFAGGLVQGDSGSRVTGDKRLSVVKRLGRNLPKKQQALKEPLDTAFPLSIACSEHRSTGRPASFQARPGIAKLGHNVSSLIRAAGLFSTNDELPPMVRKSP